MEDGAERRCHGHDVSVVKLSKEIEESCVAAVITAWCPLSPSEAGEAHEGD